MTKEKFHANFTKKNRATIVDTPWFVYCSKKWDNVDLTRRAIQFIVNLCAVLYFTTTVKAILTWMIFNRNVVKYSGKKSGPINEPISNNTAATPYRFYCWQKAGTINDLLKNRGLKNPIFPILMDEKSHSQEHLMNFISCFHLYQLR